MGPAEAGHYDSLSAVVSGISRAVVLLPQQPKRVRDDDQRRAHVGDDRHP
jgi:hypothetical protein